MKSQIRPALASSLNWTRASLALAVLIGGLVIGIQPARADMRGPDFSQFSAALTQALAHCQTPAACQAAGYGQTVLFDVKTQPSLLGTTLPHLDGIGREQAEIWADTILEGDYDAEGATTLDHVEGITSGGRLIAYRITYSQRAWQLGENGQRQQEGRISESTYVSVPLTSWLRDSNALASFN